MIHVHDIEQGSPAWLKLRENLYTGTGAEKLLAYAGQIKIINGVASSYALTEITGFTGNFYTRRGHILEDEALELYSSITGHRVDTPGFITNDGFPSCGYSPDGHDADLAAILEVKCFKEDKHLAMFDGAIPIKILAQIYFGMFIWNKRRARLIIYNPDLEDPAKCFKIIEIKYNRNIMNNFKRKLSTANGKSSTTKAAVH